MNKTLSIALAGFSFIIEEHAYHKLSDYLTALRSSLEPSEADEVMHDIEIRMVEILKENMGKREVVNDEDIEKIITLIGKPEIIEEQEHAYYSEKTEKQKNTAEQKQLFRDAENQKIGGVCAGLAAYFGIEMTWMRVIWFGIGFLGLFTAGVSTSFVIMLYLVLWIILPKAQTAADYLKMKGKPLNFDNIKEESSNIIRFANESSVKVGEIYHDAKPLVSNAGNGLIKIIRGILGIFFAFLALGALVGLFFIFGIFGFPSFPGVTKMNFLFDDGGLRYVLTSIIILTDLFLAILFSLISIKLFFPKTKLKNTGYILGGLFLIIIILGTYFGVSMAKIDLSYKGNKEEAENIALNIQPNDSIILEKKQVIIPSNFTAYDADIFSDKKIVFEEEYPHVTVVRNPKITQPYLIVKKYAEGYNKPLELNVPIEVIGNKILLPNFISYPYPYRFRHYNVDYELVVPKSMKVYNTNDDINTNGDLDANGINDDDEGKNIDKNTISFEENKININGTQIEYRSDDADSVIINGKKFPKRIADSILKKDLKNLDHLKDLEDLKNLNISIKDGKSKIEIKTNK